MGSARFVHDQHTPIFVARVEEDESCQSHIMLPFNMLPIGDCFVELLLAAHFQIVKGSNGWHAGGDQLPCSRIPLAILLCCPKGRKLPQQSQNHTDTPASIGKPFELKHTNFLRSS